MTDFRRLSLKQLRAFVATVRRGSVTMAANDLSVTPPAITTQFKLLEAGVGAPLFDRSAVGFVPTDIGRELFETALDIEHQIDGWPVDRRAATGAAGSVILRCVSSANMSPRASSRSSASCIPGHPGQTGGGQSRGDRSRPRTEPLRPDVIGRPAADIPVVSAVLSDHPNVLIAPPGHPLVGDPDILVEDLLRERFLARERDPGRGNCLGSFSSGLGAVDSST